MNVMPGRRGEVLEQVELLAREAGRRDRPTRTSRRPRRSHVAELERQVIVVRSPGPVRRSTARTRATTSRGENGFVT